MADEIKWITINHVHIPIKPGQTKDEAVKEFTESQKKKKATREKSIDKLKNESIVYTDEKDNLPQIILPYGEYKMVMSELATNLTEEEYKNGFVIRSIRNYTYFVVIDGFGSYRIIGKTEIPERIHERKKKG